MTDTQLNDAFLQLRSQLHQEPTVGIILGSGLGGLANHVEQPTIVPYRDLPGLPVTSVPGHEGRFYCGTLAAQSVLVMQGRLHFYEGYSMAEIVSPVRLMAMLGIKTLIVTNAAGAINPEYRAGELMVIKDHLKLCVESPLRGPNRAALGPRFNDMSQAYDAHLRDVAHRTAERLGVPLREGIYAFMGGPSFETPAEIRMLRTLGADAVGMSTVPEVIAAAHAGMKVLGISALTNMASGLSDHPPSHQEVLEVGKRIENHFVALVVKIVGDL